MNFSTLIENSCLDIRQICRTLVSHTPEGVRDAFALFAGYTGVRWEELTALSLRDFREEYGIAFFDFAENDGRGVKTLAVERGVPVHDRLIALGLLDYVAAVRPQKTSDLFPELEANGHVKGSSDRSIQKYRQALATRLISLACRRIRNLRRISR